MNSDSIASKIQNRLSAKWWEGLVLAGAMGLMFVLYRYFRILMQPIHKNRADYTDPVFLWSSFFNSLSDWKFWLGLLTAIAIAFFCRKLKRWKDFTPGTRMQWMVWTLLLVSLWSSAFYPINYYYGQVHLLDRLVLIALGLACFRWPTVLPFFTWAVLVSYLQWRLPIGDPELTNRKLPVDLLLSLNAALLLWPWKAFPRRAIVLTLVSVVLIHYWIPGLAKFAIGEDRPWDWLLVNKAMNMMLAATQLGWTVLWDENGAASLWQLLIWMDTPLKIFVLVVELGLLLSFWSRRVLLAFTASRILLHLGILFFSGDTFWNWTLLGIGMMAAFWPERIKNKDADQANHKSQIEPLFGWVPMLVVVVFILFASRSYDASPLGWFDSRLSERYDVWVVTESGQRRQMDPNFFAPYEFLFIQSKFHYLPGTGKVLVRTYGAVHDPEAARDLRAAHTIEEVRNVIKQRGEKLHNKKKAEGLDKFLKTWFHNHESMAGTVWTPVFSALHPPPHALAFPAGDQAYDPEKDGRVEAVEIVFERQWFDGQKITRMDTEVIHELKITD